MAARIEQRQAVSWRNYHDTVTRQAPDRRELVADDLADPSRWLSETGAALRGLLADAAGRGVRVQTIGSAWSFSRLLSGSGVLLTMPEAIWPVPADAVVTAPAPGHRLVLVAAGTRIATLNAWARAHGLSLATSGSHDGQTIAGACGTSVHGSVLGFGGIQNHVRGVHLICGPGRSLWLERGVQPVLADAFVAGFATPRREAEPFDAALVHLGGLGIVNAMLLELPADYGVAVVRRRQVWNDELTAALAAGDHAGVARTIWPEAARWFPGRDPYYLEVVLNPFAGATAAMPPLLRWPRPALVTLYWQTPPVPDPEADPKWFDDPLNLLARFRGRRPAKVPGDVGDIVEALLAERFLPPWAVADAIRLMFEQTPDGGEEPRRTCWGSANGPHRPIAGIDLFNAAYAAPRDRLPDLLAAMTRALLADGLAGAAPVVFTLRFVRAAAGLLAFQRFEDSVVVNMDGVRGAAAFAAARRIALELELAEVPFSQHWGKQGEITAARVEREFGGRAARWKAARTALLEPGMASVVINDALIDWGLA